MEFTVEGHEGICKIGIHSSPMWKETLYRKHSAVLRMQSENRRKITFNKRIVFNA